ncbi:speckle-type POZ protein-like [Schistocerca nitens]|uniref:speckle-type POZ protein-like n=1 Tax=Schistocerca nitens TaxID=7011 RepID=UPI0021181D1C|nr:speckle-type POZ protein-like [Schistocerca nitens]
MGCHVVHVNTSDRHSFIQLLNVIGFHNLYSVLVYMPLTKTSEPFTKIFHETVVNVRKFEYTWKIRNITHCGKQPGEALESSIFCAGDDCSVKWQLLLYPYGSYKEFRKSLSLHLTLVSCHQSSVYAKYRFSLLDSNEKEHFVKSTSWAVLFRPGYWQGYDEYVDRSSLLDSPFDLLSDDTLTIRCSGGVVADWTVPVPECSLREDLGALLDSARFGDVWLWTLDGRHLLAHKAILAARSPVFSAMFNHNMEETNCNRVDITDVDYDVLREVVRYMYTGHTPNLEGAADCLLAAADKYQLPGLKAMCENELGAGLTTENAAGLLILADRHGAASLKERTLRFIDAHLKHVIGTAGWKQVTLSHPNLVKEVSGEPLLHDGT